MTSCPRKIRKLPNRPRSSLKVLIILAILLNALQRHNKGSEYDISKHYIGTKAIQNAVLKMRFEKQKVKNVMQQTQESTHG